MANYYVTPNGDGTWNALKEKATRASGVFQTQKKAEKAAKTFSENSGGGEVRIMGVRGKYKGKFRDSDTVKPGNDPCPPKDRVY